MQTALTALQDQLYYMQTLGSSLAQPGKTQYVSHCSKGVTELTNAEEPVTTSIAFIILT